MTRSAMHEWTTSHFFVPALQMSVAFSLFVRLNGGIGYATIMRDLLGEV
jgi:hypothetical protein